MKVFIFSFSELGRKIQSKYSKDFNNLNYEINYFSDFNLDVCDEEIKEFNKNSDIAIKNIHKGLNEVLNFSYTHASILIFISDISNVFKLLLESNINNVKNEKNFPLILVIDTLEKFVIPINSNKSNNSIEITRLISEIIGAEPVITSYNELNSYNLQNWASKNQFNIIESSIYKNVENAISKGEKIGIYSDYKINGVLPTCFEIINIEEYRKYKENLENVESKKNDEDNKVKKNKLIDINSGHSICEEIDAVCNTVENIPKLKVYDYGIYFCVDRRELPQLNKI